VKKLYLADELGSYPYPFILIRIDDTTGEIVGKLLKCHNIKEIPEQSINTPEMIFMGWSHWGEHQAGSIIAILEDAGYKPIDSVGKYTVHQLCVQV